MAKYQLIKQGVRDTETKEIIPEYPKNRFWIKYQIWLSEGNEPDPIEPDPTPPTENELLEIALNNRAIRALIRTLNDGTFVPGSNYTPAERRAIFRA